MSGNVLIVGGGAIGQQISQALKENGISTLRISQEASLPVSSGEPPDVIPGTRLEACRGAVGDFRVILENESERYAADAASIVIAEEAQRHSLHAAYGIEPSSRVVPLSAVNGLWKSGSSDREIPREVKTVAFLHGLTEESHPAITRAVMEAARFLQTRKGAKTYILTRNLKVADDGLEKLFRAAREAGTVFIKFTETAPEIRQDGEGRIDLFFTDEITSERFRLAPDLLVVDEAIRPSSHLKKLAQVLELHLDEAGFIQADNVRRLTVRTNRRGVFAAGSARRVMAPGEAAADVRCAVLEIVNLLHGTEKENPEFKASINTGQCIRCLTCFRICPHRAVVLNARPAVQSEACEGCGICVAECPREAITIPDEEVPAMPEPASGIPPGMEGSDGSPFIMAFCCSRSAARAADLARSRGLKLPEELKIVQVPCGGRVSLDHLLEGLRKDADGILVLTCHEGNCHSERGNRFARGRVDQLREMLSTFGIEGERLRLATLAANMGKELADILGDFENTLRELGPSRVKSSSGRWTVDSRRWTVDGGR